MDVTWNLTTGIFAHFNEDDEHMLVDKTPMSQFKLPKCSQMDMNYFELKHTRYSLPYSEQQLLQWIGNRILQELTRDRKNELAMTRLQFSKIEGDFQIVLYVDVAEDLRPICK